MYEADAAKVLEAIAAIKAAAAQYGVKSTMFTMAALAEGMKLAQTSTMFGSLPAEQRDEFFAELWDAAIGNEPAALVHQVGFLGPDAVEKLSDGMKAAALAYFNRALPAAV